MIEQNIEHNLRSDLFLFSMFIFGRVRPLPMVRASSSFTNPHHLSALICSVVWFDQRLRLILNLMSVMKNKLRVVSLTLLLLPPPHCKGQNTDRELDRRIGKNRGNWGLNASNARIVDRANNGPGTDRKLVPAFHTP